MPGVITEVFIPGIPPLPNRTRGQHWAELYKTKRDWELVIGLLAKRLEPVQGRALIHFHIQVGSGRKIDPDNLAWCVTKPSLDALQNIGIIRGDSIDDIELSYSFDRNPVKGFKISVKSLS